VLLRSVVWKRVWRELGEKRRRPPGEFQRVKALADVIVDFSDDGCLLDEAAVRPEGPRGSQDVQVRMPV